MLFSLYGILDGILPYKSAGYHLPGQYPLCGILVNRGSDPLIFKADL